MNLSPRKQLFVDTASKMFGNGAVLSKPQIREAAAEAKIIDFSSDLPSAKNKAKTP